MFKLIGIIVIFVFFFRMGKRTGGGKNFGEFPQKMKKKMKDTVETIKTGTKRYFYEEVIDERGKKEKRIRAIEEINHDEYIELRDEVR